MGATLGINNVNTGRTNTRGMDWGETTGKEQMKLFGIEDFWGYAWERIDGFYCDSIAVIRTATENFNDTGENYIENESFPLNDVGYMSQFEVSADANRINYGFLPVAVNGSATTYFCDEANLLRECSPLFGGTRDSGTAAGAFNLNFIKPSTASSSYVARLMYL
jgi:hypothetical protein